MNKSENTPKIQDALLRQLKEQEHVIEEQQNKINLLDTENFQLKNLIDNLPGDIYWKDKEGIWSGVNKRGAQSLLQIGFIRDRSDVIGKSDYQLFSKETADEYRKNDLEVMTLKTEITREEVNLLPNGEKIIQLSTKRPLWDKEGNVVGVVGNTIDISYLKKIEAELKTVIDKAESASQAKTEFLENMRHDIRTPLTGIVGFADILKMESDSPQIKEYAENLVASSHALLDLMDEVLEAIRVSSGEIPKLKKKFDLKLVLNKIMNLYRAKAAEKKLQLNFIYDKNLPQYVIGDKIRLHRIILELIGNALNFTHTGHVTLTAELAIKEDRNFIIKLQVTDSGIGIMKDKQQEIYLQFKRLTPSYQGLYKGAGLGLYIVKQFIDELDGEIYVNSTLGEGSTFSCVIPLKEPLLHDNSGVEDEEASSEEKRFLTPLSARLTYSDKSKKSNKILVVEDNQIAQKVAVTLLSSMDCNVDIASSGQEALKQIKKHRYDLIFMDIGLGDGADGYEVTKQIRKREKDNEHIPIVALTAHAAEENKQHCISAGMDAVLSKPITKTHASNILDHFVRDQSLEREKIEQAKLDLPDTEEELFALDQFPILEVEQTLKNLGDKSIFVELLKDLIEVSLPQDFTRMKDAFASKDYEQVEKLAHKMKGGAVYVGTTRMKYACQYLERYWKSGQQEQFEKLYAQAVSVIEETAMFVKNWLKSGQ